MLSVVLQYGQQVWPYPTIVQPSQQPTPEQWAEFLELVEKARKFDEMAAQSDCEDPAKVEWMRDIEDRLAALEDI